MNLEIVLHPLTDFISEKDVFEGEKVSYYYTGICQQTKKKLHLPRTLLAEKIALRLCAELDRNNLTLPKGKMLGILIVKDSVGKMGFLKAFSGFWGGKKEIPGWVNQIPANSILTMAEKLTIQKLDEIREKIISLKSLSLREEYKQLEQQFQQEWQSLKEIHRVRKTIRAQVRQGLNGDNFIDNKENFLKDLEQESRKDDWERRKLKHHWLEILAPLKEKIDVADQEIQELKKQRKELSRQLQAQMQMAYSVTNFAGESLSIGRVLGKDFIPTGTGDCCAPKLLHYAATHNLIPVAMAEVWWGETSANGEKVKGRFYPACEARCQPLMGFLLSGLPTVEVNRTWESIPIIYEDDYLLVVNKPSGLLSVSGRGVDKFDSVETRFRQISTAKSNIYLKTVHRLDQDTSGILILAKDKDTYIKMSQWFAQRKVKKIYEAIVEGVVKEDEGMIELPLWGNPRSRPRQEVNYQYGKPSVTHYRVMERGEKETRLELMPLTGRTHQLRVHCLQGLGMAIRGDRIYGRVEDKIQEVAEERQQGIGNGQEGISQNSSDNDEQRLCLHAREISFTHPQNNKEINLKTQTPF